jgi:hypothetical protein
VTPKVASRRPFPCPSISRNAPSPAPFGCALGPRLPCPAHSRFRARPRHEARDRSTPSPSRPRARPRPSTPPDVPSHTIALARGRPRGFNPIRDNFRVGGLDLDPLDLAGLYGGRDSSIASMLADATSIRSADATSIALDVGGLDRPHIAAPCEPRPLACSLLSRESPGIAGGLCISGRT